MSASIRRSTWTYGRSWPWTSSLPEPWFRLGHEVGGTALASGDLDRAVDFGMRGMLSNHAMGDVASLTLLLAPTATILFLAGLPGDAATLCAAYEAHSRRHGVRPPLDVEDWMGLKPVIEAMQATIAGPAFEEATRLGASMTTDAVVEFLLREALPRFKARDRAASQPAPAP